MSPEPDDLSIHAMEEAKRLAEPASATAPMPLPRSLPPASTIVSAGVPEEREGDPDALQLRNVIEMFRRHKALVLGLTLFFPLCAFLYDSVLNRPTIPARFRVGSPRTYAASLEIERLDTAGNESFDNQGGRLPAPAMQSASVEALVRHPGFAGEYGKALAEATNGGSPDLQDRARRFAESFAPGRDPSGASLDISPETERRQTISFQGGEPDLLPFLAQAIVPALNHHVANLRKDVAAAYQGKIESVLAETEKDVQAAWGRLRTLNGELAALDPAGLPATSDDDAKKLEWEVRSLTIELDYAKARNDYEALRKRFFIGDDRDVEKILGETPARKELAALQSQLEQARTRYRDEHPKVQQLREDIQAKLRALRDAGETTSLGEVPPIPSPRDAEALRKIAALQDGLAVKRNLLQALRVPANAAKPGSPADDRIETMRMRRDVLRGELEDARARALALRSKLSDLRLSADQTGAAQTFACLRMDTAARLIRPRVWLDLMVSVFVGLLVGGSLALLLEHMDDRLHTPADIQTQLRLNFLGVVPFWRKKDVLIDPAQPDAQIAEVYAHLCNNLRYGRAGNPERRLLIASATQSEGKSVIAANLAIRYALEGNQVLLIDTDLRHPRVTGLLVPFLPGNERPSVGLAEHLAGGAALESVIVPTTIPGLRLLPSGTPARNAVKLLGTPEMLGVLHEAERRYDIVIVDSPAVLPVVDASLIAPHMRGVLLVVAAHEAKIAAVRMALYRLEHVNAPLVGAILNKVKMDWSGYAYYGYRGGAYDNAYAPTYVDQGDTP